MYSSDSDIIIQLNFTSGFGDLYCSMVDVLNIVSRCKQFNLTADFIYNFDRNYYFFDTDSINILNFFESDNFLEFKNIKKTHAHNSIDNYKHIFTPHLPKDRFQGGLHLWDLFLSNKKIDFEDRALSTISCHAMNNFGDISKIKVIPEFAPKIKNLGFKETNLTAIHFRTNDSSECMDIINNHTTKVKEIIDSNKTYILSNSKNIRNYFLNYNHPNILMYNSRHEHVGYHFYAYKGNSKDNNQLIENLEDTIVEMYNLSLCKKIYTSTEWSRPSNFLFYSKIKTPSIEFTTL